jgi:small subunit ribosomal protein S6
MKRKYEAMIVLDTRGKEESVEDIISGISREMEKAGLSLEQIDQKGKHKFPFNPRHVDSGYFVNVQFEAEPEAVTEVQTRLKLNENIYQQYYQRR